MLSEGFLGIVTGILTTWILFLGKVVWDAKVTPFIRETRYQGVKVEGAWSGSFKDEKTETESRLFIDQSAHDLSGSFMVKYKDETKNFVIDFNVRGYMWQGYITLNFIPKDRRVTSYGTALLKLHDGGGNLVGQWCIRNVMTEQVEAWPMTLSRDLSHS